MKIKTILVHKVKNLGNYESERLEVMAELEESEDPNIAIEQLRMYVHIKLQENIKEANSEDSLAPIPF